MTTLEDLYYGNISPHERYIKRGRTEFRTHCETKRNL